MADYPEAEKLGEALPEYQAQEAFILWLREQGYYLAQERCPHGRLPEDMVNCTESEYCRDGRQDTRLYTSRTRLEELLYRFHGVDEDKLEEERRQMLAGYENLG